MSAARAPGGRSWRCSTSSADAGACGQVHLATGSMCTLEQGHAGSCGFVAPDQVEESLSERRNEE